MSKQVNFNCEHEQMCRTRKYNPDKCKSCVNNKLRNYKVDFYEAADDNEFPEIYPVLRYKGAIEQTVGYKCPVCEKYSHPFHIKDNRCEHCRYVLNIE